MELFEMIRRGHAAGETIHQLARKHKVHRRTVRQALESGFRRAQERRAGTTETGTGQGIH